MICTPAPVIQWMSVSSVVAVRIAPVIQWTVIAMRAAGCTIDGISVDGCGQCFSHFRSVCGDYSSIFREKKKRKL